MKTTKTNMNKISKLAFISLLVISLCGIALLLSPVNAHAGILFNKNQKEINKLQNNVSNDGNRYKEGVTRVDSPELKDSAGHSHGMTILFPLDTSGPWDGRYIEINKDNFTKLDNGAIRGTDYKDDFEGHCQNIFDQTYLIMDIRLEVHDNNLKMIYKTDTPWNDFDGAEWTLDFGNGYVHQWQDRKDGSDSENHTFSAAELNKYFGLDGEATTLQQAIENGQCSLRLSRIYIDDFRTEV